MVHSRRHHSISSIFFMVILFFISLSTPTVHSADVILTWHRPDDARISGYKIFYGPADTDFKAVPNEIIHSPDQTSCYIFNLRPGNTYGFAAKSMDKAGNESGFSEVIFYDVPIKPPDDSPNGHDDGDDGNGDNGDGNDGGNGDGSDDDDNDGEDDKRGGGGGGCFIRVVSAP